MVIFTDALDVYDVDTALSSPVLFRLRILSAQGAESSHGPLVVFRGEADLVAPRQSPGRPASVTRDCSKQKPPLIVILYSPPAALGPEGRRIVHHAWHRAAGIIRLARVACDFYNPSDRLHAISLLDRQLIDVSEAQLAPLPSHEEWRLSTELAWLDEVVAPVGHHSRATIAAVFVKIARIGDEKRPVATRRGSAHVIALGWDGAGEARRPLAACQEESLLSELGLSAHFLPPWHFPVRAIA